MRTFNFLKYIRKYRYIIFTISILGLISIYLFATRKQEYAASITIEYTNKDASKGYTPNGQPITLTDIYSSDVISKVIENLSLSDSPDYLRTRFAVKEIIPEEEKEKKESALANGQSYEYFPTKYIVTFTANNTKSIEYARQVLNETVKVYIDSYSEKYINQAIVANTSNTLLEQDYELLDGITIVETNVNNILSYTKEQSTKYPDFRSAKTGYTFVDLYNIFSFLKDNEIPKLYAYIINNHLAKDTDLLITKYENMIANNLLLQENLQSKIEKQDSLLDEFVAKTKEQMSYVYNTSDMASKTGSYIISDVNDTDSTITMTTYDDMIIDYAKLVYNHNELDVDNEYYDNLIESFQKVEENENVDIEELVSAESRLNGLIENIDRIYNLLYDTSTELNQYLSATNIKPISTVFVDETINIKLYLFIGFILSFGVGIFGVMVLGRLEDFFDYKFYTDSITHLPNKNACNRFMSRVSKLEMLKGVTVASLIVENIKEINDRLNREEGNNALSLVGDALNTTLHDGMFIGYNDSGIYLVITNKDSSYVESYIKDVKLAIKAAEDPDKISIKVKYNIENSQENNKDDIRDLVRYCISNMPEEKHE